MAKSFLLGSAHHLYIAVTGAAGATTLPLALTGDFGDTTVGLVTADDIAVSATAPDNRWLLCDNIRDLDEGGQNNTVDTTTRAEARKGIATEVITTVSGNLSFELRYKPRDTATVQDLAYHVLLRAAVKGLEIAAMDLDGPLATSGSMGRVANFSVSFQRRKPVQGLSVVQFSLGLSGYPEEVVSSGTALTKVFS